MIQLVRTARRSAPAVVLLAGLAACAGRGIDTREYVLTPVSGPRTVSTRPADSGIPPKGPGARGDASAELAKFAVGVGPVELPDYLRRPQIVTREGNRLRPSEAHRWAGDLRANFSSVLAQNLAILIPTSEVPSFPWFDRARVDYQVTVEVFRFERESEGEVSLEAHWLLRSGDDARGHRSSVSEPVEGEDYGATVEAMSRALAAMSREIATAIRNDAAAAPVP